MLQIMGLIDRRDRCDKRLLRREVDEVDPKRFQNPVRPRDRGRHSTKKWGSSLRQRCDARGGFRYALKGTSSLCLTSSTWNFDKPGIRSQVRLKPGRFARIRQEQEFVVAIVVVP